MDVRRRVVAAASAAAIFAALGVTVTSTAAAADEGPPNHGLTFTWERGVAALVTHYVVSPTQQSTAAAATIAATGAVDSRTLSTGPKAARIATEGASAAKVSAGVRSNSTIAEGSNSGGTPAASASFKGMQSSASICPYFGPGCNPPDMALGASTSWVFQGVNMSFEVLNTSGSVQPGWPVDAQKFFAVPAPTQADGTPCDTAHNGRAYMTDPRAFYDPISHRFWAAMGHLQGAFGIAVDCPFKSEYLIAVSQTSNPNGKWNVYDFNMSLDGVCWADYTEFGFNGQGVYFSGNQFDTNGNYCYSEMFEANKSKMQNGQGGFTAQGFWNLAATGPGTTAKTGPFLADTLQPAMTLDGSTGSSEYFADTIDGPDPVNGHFCGFTGLGFEDSCSGMLIWKLSNPVAHDRGGPLPSLKATYLPTKPILVAPASNQPSCNQCVDSNDLRIPGTPVVRGGKLYTAWGTAIDNGTNVVPGIVWADVSLRDAEARTEYYNLSGDAAATYPAVMPDAEGNVTMLFEHMSHTVLPETRYIVRSEEASFTGAGVLLKAGEDSYRPPLCGQAIPVCRWGDYEAVSFDGRGRIWMAGQYANTWMAGPPQNGRNWGTWIGAINTGEQG